MILIRLVMMMIVIVVHDRPFEREHCWEQDRVYFVIVRRASSWAIIRKEGPKVGVISKISDHRRNFPRSQHALVDDFLLDVAMNGSRHFEQDSRCRIEFLAEVLVPYKPHERP